MGLARLTQQVYRQISDSQSLAAPLMVRLLADKNDAAAWLDLSILTRLNFQPKLAEELQKVALSMQNHYTLAAEQPEQLRLLALMAPGNLMANTPLEFLLEHSAITLHLFYVRTVADLEKVPPHDLLFVAVGESDQNRPLLQSLVEPLRHWPQPVINRPEYILQTDREHVSALLRDIPALLIPPTRRLHRDDVLPTMKQGRYPVIIRPVDSHAGRDLEKINSRNKLTTYLARANSDWFYLSPFVNYAGRDRFFRKYRIALVGEQSYPGHMALSRHWMVHYLNAGMYESTAKRAEEARFMQHYASDFARRHQAALTEISRRTRLDYLILDCSELTDGTLLIFEIDTSAVLHDMDQGPDFAYKQQPMQAVFAAFQQFLLRRAKSA